MFIDLLFAIEVFLFYPLIIFHILGKLKGVVLWILDLTLITRASILQIILDRVILTVGARLRHSKEGNK